MIAACANRRNSSRTKDPRDSDKALLFTGRDAHYFPFTVAEFRLAIVCAFGESDSYLHGTKEKTRFHRIRTCGVALAITMRLINDADDCYRGWHASIETSST